MKKNFIRFAAVMLAAAAMTGCGKSYDFSQKDVAEAIGVKKEVFDEMDVTPGDEGDTGNELMEQAKAMTGTDFYTYSFVQSDSENEYDIIDITFSGGKVGTVKVTAVSFENLELVQSEYSVLGIHAGDKIADAEAKAEAFFGEKGSAMSDDEQMWVLTDGVKDYISYGDFSGKKGYLGLSVDREEDVVLSVEYSLY